MNNLKQAKNFISTSLSEPVLLRLDIDNLSTTENIPQTIPEYFHERCQKYKERFALAYEKCIIPNRKKWVYVTFAEYERKVHQTALLLLHLNVKERSSIGILANNCPEWFYVEMAAISIGAVVVGIYPTSSAEAIQYSLRISNASICFAGNTDQLEKIRSVQMSLPKLHAIIHFNETIIKSPGIYAWSDLFNKQFNSNLNSELLVRKNNIGANECAMIIFTSGTMGMPKGVLLSHDGLTYNVKTMAKLLVPLNLNHFNQTNFSHDKILSYLPLSHVAAQMFDIFLAMELGACVYFSDYDTLRVDIISSLLNVRPTIFFGVPRVFEKIEEKTLKMLNDINGWRILCIHFARKFLINYFLHIKFGIFPSELMFWLANKVVKQLKILVGLENCRYIFIGGAPVTKELKSFFLSIGMPLTDIFGMSETSGGVVINFDYSNLDIVGKPIAGFEIKINNLDEKNSGEVCLKGRTIFMGYLNKPEKTRDVLDLDGWLHTGDWGSIDIQGNLTINDRIKNLIITSGGENIPITRIENLIKKELPCVSNVLLIGDQKKYLTVLLTFKTLIDENTGRSSNMFEYITIDWFKNIGLNITKLTELFYNSESNHSMDMVIQSIEKVLERVNKQVLSNAQRVQYFTILSQDFLVSTGELGPTLKVKRQAIIEKYGKHIDEMYKPGFHNKFVIS